MQLKHTTLWILFKDNNIVLTHENIFLDASAYASLTPNRLYSLGDLNHNQFFCGEIAENYELPSSLAALPLRNALEIIPPDFLPMAIKAFSVLSWDRNHQFCGRCGSETLPQSGRYERRCPRCHLSVFPRISPCVIVLIKKGDEILMTRSHHFRPGLYGLVAGFIEPGESLEEGLQREVEEEVGIKVKNIKYYHSQPWPFPDSLMMGFMADYAGGELKIDPIEIEDAGWYHYDKLPASPSNISIAGRLIQSYIDEKKGQK